MGRKTLQMITPKEALDLLKEGKQICIIKEYSLEDGLSVMELLTEDLAAVVEQDAPETSKKSGGGYSAEEETGLGKDQSPGRCRMAPSEDCRRDGLHCSNRGNRSEPAAERS